MGIVSTTLSQSNNMKFLLVLAVAAYARAEAEAKPGFAYHVGHPLTYAHLPLAYHHAPLVYAAPAGCRNNDGALVPCAQGVLPALAPLHAVAAPVAEAEDEAVVSVEKRDAEAEPTAEADAEADPEADPWLYYHGLGYAAHPYGYGYYGHHLGYAGYYGHHLGYAGYGYYGHPLGYYGKRSAEAEPTAEADAEADPEADPWLYYHGLGYAARPYGYGYYGHHLGYAAYAGYHPYAYYGGCRNGYGALVPCA